MRRRLQSLRRLWLFFNKLQPERAIRDLVELLNENDGLDENVEFDYMQGEFVEEVYTPPDLDIQEKVHHISVTPKLPTFNSISTEGHG